MLLLTALLLTGAGSMKADKRVWNETVVGGTCYDNYGGSETVILISNTEFEGAEAGNKLRVHATPNADSNGRWTFFIASNYWYSTLQFANWYGSQSNKTFDYDSPSNYDATKGYFQFELTDNSLEPLAGSAQGGIRIHFLGLTVTEVWLITTDDEEEPEPDPTPVTYTLTYKVDGEVYGEVETIEYGATITPRTEPTREGYTFSGWSGLPSTMPDRNVEVTGIFVKNKEYVTATVSSETGFATFCSEKALDFADVMTVKAYYAKEVTGNKVKLVQVTGTVAAGTGLLLKGSTSQIPVIDEAGTAYDNNLLQGVTGAAVSVNAANRYVLVDKEGTVKFADTAGQAATVPVGKAYLEVPASSSRMFFFDFGEEATGVVSAHADRNRIEIYNMRGQRVANPTKGLYIVNGKKHLIK